MSLSESHRKFPWLLPVLIFILGFFMRVQSPSVTHVNIYCGRDLSRAIEMLEGERFYTTGSELTYGGRTPGSFLYLLQMIPLSLNYRPFAVTIFLAILDVIALVLTYLFTLRIFGRRIALVATVFFAVFPLQILHQRYLFNPCYIFPFVVGAVFSAYMLIAERRSIFLVPLVLLLGLALQLHFSVVGVLGVVLFLMIVFQTRLRPVDLGCALLVLALLFLPYLLGEIHSDFLNTTFLFTQPGREVNERLGDMTLARSVNFDAIPGLLHNYFIDVREPRGLFDFSLFGSFRRYYLENNHPLEPFLEAALALSNLQILFFVVGLSFCGAFLIKQQGFRRLIERVLGGKEDKSVSMRMAIGAMLVLLWALLPPVWIVLAGIRPNDICATSYRYSFWMYPAQFIIMGIGVVGILKALKKRAHRALVRGVVAFIIVFQVAFMSLFFTMSGKTGLIFAGYPREAYGLPIYSGHAIEKLANTMIENYGFCVDDYRHRFFSNFFNGMQNEETLDYYFKIHPGFWKSPSEEREIFFVLTDDDYNMRNPPKFNFDDYKMLDELRVTDLLDLVKGQADLHLRVFKGTFTPNLHFSHVLENPYRIFSWRHSQPAD